MQVELPVQVSLQLRYPLVNFYYRTGEFAGDGDMGKRDFRHHEAKKPKKDARKIIQATIMEPAPPPVEIIKRKRKERPEEE